METLPSFQQTFNVVNAASVRVDPCFQAEGFVELPISTSKNNGLPRFPESLNRICSEVKLHDAIYAVQQSQKRWRRIPPDTVYQLLQRCIDENDLAAGRDVRELIRCSALETDTFLGSHVIRMLTHFEEFQEANQVFGKLVDLDIFTWTAIITANVKLGDYKQAIHLYEQMLEAGVAPDGHVFVEVLRACAGAVASKEGQRVHALVIESGLEGDIFVGSSLLTLRVNCGSLQDARILFNRLPKRDRVTWSTLMSGYIDHRRSEEVLELFMQMQNDGVEPDQLTCVCLLLAVSDIGDLDQGWQIHNYILEHGLPVNLHVGNALVDMYVKCGSIEDARMVFDDLGTRNVVTWSSLISGYGENKEAQEAFLLFDQMQQQGLQPNEVTYIAMLKASSEPEEGAWVHQCLTLHGLELSLQVGSALVDVYVRCGWMHDAHSVFDKLSKRNVVTWSILITGYMQYGAFETAFELLEKMQEQGVEANVITFLSMIKVCSPLPGSLEHGWLLHSKAIQSGLGTDVSIGNALIDLYAKCGSFEDTSVVFQALPDRDIISWTALLGMYAQEDTPRLDGLRVLEQMKQSGIEPNHITYGYVLKLLSSLAALGHGRRVHACILQSGLEVDEIVSNGLVDIYSKCGQLDDAFLVFERVHKKTLAMWSAVLTSCAQHGSFLLASRVFEGMVDAGIRPDAVAFLCLLSACKTVAEGCESFKSMRDNYGVVSTVEHYNAMIDILGHNGCLGEAEDLLESNPFGPDVVGWTSLLHSCKMHANVVLGKRCFDHILSVDPQSSAAYVLLSVAYSHAGMPAHAEHLERMRRTHIGWKKLAHAFIEVDGHVHDFAVGDKLHPRSSDIYAKLDALNVWMRKEGYTPRLDIVVGPKSVEEKAEALCGHSEKLAMAFGLISSPAGATIRISKNLRMCVDCHTTSKFASKVEMREVVITDTYCIHRFNDGVCSCEDYPYKSFV